MQLYAIALYVEEDEAVKELKRLESEGFFTNYSTNTLCQALLQGSFKKFLQFRLLRDVSYSQFTGEIGRDLKPRLDSSGDPSLWMRFAGYFQDKSLSKGSSLLALIKGKPPVNLLTCPSAKLASRTLKSRNLNLKENVFRWNRHEYKSIIATL